MTTNLPTSRSHRTALVIDTRNGTGSTFTERYKRLLQSVNGPNIKVDIYTLSGAQTGAALVPGAPHKTTTAVEPDSIAVEPDSIDLNAWAASLGYDQLVVTVAPKSS